MRTRSSSHLESDSPRRVSGVSLALVAVLLSARGLFGQEDSRAEQIGLEREAVHSQVEPETMNKVEKAVYQIEDKRLLPRINSGWNGIRVKIGGLPQGGGFS